MVARRGNGSGFTLIELLVVLAIIGVLAAILLPAVQAAREAARRVKCLNNMKQLGLAAQNYESAVRSLPPSGIRLPGLQCWYVAALPYVEQVAVFELMDLRKNWDHSDNQRAVAVPIPTLLCPSAPVEAQRQLPIGSGKFAARSDYAIPRSISATPVQAGYVRSGPTKGAMDSSEPVRFKQIKDGLSNTLLVIEDAGRPEHWIRSGRGEDNWRDGCPNANVNNGIVSGGAWADPRNDIPLHGFQVSGLYCPGPCAVNCTNNNEAFGFHNGGVAIVLVDASTHFLEEDVDIQTYASLVTRAGSEVLPPDLF